MADSGKYYNSIVLPIYEGFAEQIYEGVKEYEFRETPLPRDLKYIALFEDGPRQISGGFLVGDIHERSIEELWQEFAKDISVYERFHDYYSDWDRAIAIEVLEAEEFAEPVDIETLEQLGLHIPRQFYFKYITDEVMEELSRRSDLLSEHVLGRDRNDLPAPHPSESASHTSLNYRPMGNEEEEEFRKLFLESPVPTEYLDIDEDFVNHILTSHKQREDPYGYFTKKKIVYTILAADEIVGFITTTWKRGGSVKYGPTVLKEDARGNGIGPDIRRMIDARLGFEGIRKTYSTIPDTEIPSFKYLIRSNYHIEAHMRRQYHEEHSELVFGKVLNRGELQTVEHVPHRGSSEGLDFSVGSDSVDNFHNFVIEKSEPWYDEINGNFVDSVVEAERRSLTNKYSKKGKRVYTAHSGREAHVVAIASLKRGNSVKISPVLTDVSGEVLVEFLSWLENDLKGVTDVRKCYSHIPVLDGELLSAYYKAEYTSEGVLKEPYKPGIDMVFMGKFVK